MRFAFSDDQLAFRDAVRELLAKVAGPDVLRSVWDGPLGWDPATWSHLAEMGVLGLLAPESAGGLGLTEIDLVLVLEECGRAAVPGPLVEHAAVAVPTLAAWGTAGGGPSGVPLPDIGGKGTPVGAAGPAPPIDRWLRGAAAGSVVVTAAPDARVVPFGAEADLIVVERDGAVHTVERADLTGTDARTSVDRSRRLAAGGWKRATPLPGADPALLRARGAAGTAAVLCGLAAHLVETTAAYVKERHQFGVPVGSFQAVKHHLADALIALEHARPAVYCAAWSLATGQPTSTRDAAFAKVYANEAAGLAARVALQCHGAIGYTFEHDLHLWLKRVWSLQRAWGDTPAHRAAVAATLVG
ncbi:MAG TPA: acyl-CoA dehydrogenase family protein [Acidimicrobiia bacterium]|nr:acyl-CoA dehydrogenase family protein [Acidimicrobiia bacterium]